MKVIDMKVILHTDLHHHKLRDFSYEGPSYGGGNCAWVLCEPAQLIEELQGQMDPDKYQPLINEMRLIPAGVLIALEG